VFLLTFEHCMADSVEVSASTRPTRAAAMLLLATCCLSGVTWEGGAARAAAATPALVRPSAELTAPDSAPLDAFGSALAVSGNTLVVGAPNHPGTGGGGEGAVYVYRKPAAGWSHLTLPVAQLTPSDGTEGEHFGQSVAISGDTVVVGAPDAGPTSTGAAYVFVRPRGGWAQVGYEDAKLTIGGGAAFDKLGAAVGVSGGTVVASAPDRDVAGITDAGAAYVFTAPATGWVSTTTPAATLSPSGAARGDQFGTALAISGATVVGTSIRHVANSRQGVADVFRMPSTGWTGSRHQVATLEDVRVGTGTAFGSSISMTGTTVAAGTGDPSTPASGDAAVHVFAAPTSGWTGIHTDSATLRRSGAAPTDQFGVATAISANRIVAGAPGQAGAAGDAYLYAVRSSGWLNSDTPVAEIRPVGLVAGDGYGSAVAAQTGLVLVSAPNHAVRGNASAGAVYLFSGPQLTAASETRHRFRARHHRPVLDPARLPAGGTAFRFTLDRPVRVALTIRVRTKNGHQRAVGTLTGTAREGANRWYFAGRFPGRHKLPAGHYTAILTASNRVNSVHHVYPFRIRN
jgi:hypothetical protein